MGRTARSSNASSRLKYKQQVTSGQIRSPQVTSGRVRSDRLYSRQMNYEPDTLDLATPRHFSAQSPDPADSVEFRRLTERHHRPCGVRPSAPACRSPARQRQYYAHINLQRVWPAAHGTPTTGRSGQSAGGDGPDDSGRRGTESSIVYVRAW